MLNYITYKSMKNTALCVLIAVFFIFVGCKQKTEDVKVFDVTSDSLVAKITGDSIEFVNKEGIHQKWESIAGDKINFDDIVIKTGKITDTTEDYYMLLGTTTDGNTRIGVLLEKKGDDLYFAKQDNAVVMVSCQGCKVGCDPVVVMQYGKPLVNCSPCPECLKQDKFLD